MVRDVNMDKLVVDQTVNEPITPFISKIRAMYSQLGVSSILVIGGVGSYFQVADHVVCALFCLIQKSQSIDEYITVNNRFYDFHLILTQILMDNYKPQNITAKAKALVKERMNEFKQFGKVTSRYLQYESFSNRRTGRDFKIKMFDDSKKVRYGDEGLDLGLCSQFVERGQLVAVTRILEFIKHTVLNGNGQKKQWTIYEAIEAVDREMSRDFKGTKMDVLLSANNKNNKFVRPRVHEIAAALNRLRSLKVYSDGGSGKMTGGYRVKEEYQEGQFGEEEYDEGALEAFVQDMDMNEK